MITVVAALIEKDGQLLICQRRADGMFPLKWEFPGGKVKIGEAPQKALARELAEELAVDAEVGPEVWRARHRYPEHADDLELIFYEATLQDPSQVRNLSFERIVWVNREELLEFDFLPADRELVVLLASAGRQNPRGKRHPRSE